MRTGIGIGVNGVWSTWPYIVGQLERRLQNRDRSIDSEPASHRERRRRDKRNRDYWD